MHIIGRFSSLVCFCGWFVRGHWGSWGGRPRGHFLGFRDFLAVACFLVDCFVLFRRALSLGRHVFVGDGKGAREYCESALLLYDFPGLAILSLVFSEMSDFCGWVGSI